MAEGGVVQDEHKLKQRAMRRLAVALTFIALAIAGLALLDRYNASLKKPEVPAKLPELRALPGVPQGEQSPAPQPPSLPPQAESLPPPPPPVVTNQPLLPAEPAPKTQPAPPVGQPSEGPTKKQPAAPTPPFARSGEQPAIASSAPAPSAAVNKPAPPAQQNVAPPPARPQPAELAAGKGFVVQVGVFTTAANARSLQEKLAAKGILTHLETRLVIGPFQDRAEADAVVAQLKQMGLEGMVATPH